MNNSRAPTKEEIKIYYETHDVSIKKLSEIFNISENTIKSWKARDKKNGCDWLQPATRKVATMGAVGNERKKAINEARIRVVSGETLKSASEKVGIPISTLGEYSVKENWIEKQKAFNQYMYEKLIDEKGQQHIERRKEAIEFLNYIQRKTIKSLGENDLSKDEVMILERATNIILKTMRGQAELIGVNDVQQIIDTEIAEQELELKKQKNRDPKGKDKTGSFLDKLEEFL